VSVIFPTADLFFIPADEKTWLSFLICGRMLPAAGRSESGGDRGRGGLLVIWQVNRTTTVAPAFFCVEQ